LEATQATFTVDFLRTLLSIEKEEYKDFKDFKRRVLKPAQVQFQKHTDIVFEFFEEKCETTKRTVSLTIIVRRNEQVKGEPYPTFLLSPKAELESVLDLNDQNKALRWTWQMLRQWGMTEKVFLQVLRAFPFSHVRLCVDFVCHLLEMQQTQIKKPVGYFYTLLKMYQINPIEFKFFAATEAQAAPSKPKNKSPQDSVARQAAVQRQQVKDEVDKKLTYYRRELFAREERQLDQYMSLIQPGSKAHIFGKARRRPFARFDEKLSEEDNFKFNRFFRFSCRAVLEDEMPDFFSAWHNDLREQIYDLQQQYKTL
jgi:hypothetical protein